jgi:hypothetical protein
MRIVVPVIVAARALARKVTRSPTSSGVVKRPTGILAIASATTSCGADPFRHDAETQDLVRRSVLPAWIAFERESG